MPPSQFPLPPPLPGTSLGVAALAAAPVAQTPPCDFLYHDAPKCWSAREQLDAFLRWCHANGINDVSFGTGRRILGKRHGRYRPVTARDLTPADLQTLFSVVKGGAALSMGSVYRGLYPVFLDRENRTVLRTRVTISHLTASTPGLALTLRLIASSPPTLAQVGMPVELADALDFKYGLGLVCGKMESGKTWTLAALIAGWLNRPGFDRKLLHFGSPVEFLFEGEPCKDHLFPIEVPTAVASYPDALRMAKSATPDGIIVEEANDLDTMSMMVDAAQSGIAVHGTLHIARVGEMPGAMMTYFPDAHQREARLHAAFDALQAIVIQRLEPAVIDRDPRRPDGRVCLREYLVLDAALRRRLLSQPSLSWSRVLDELVEAHGCPMIESARRCHGEGRLTDDQLRRIERGRST